MTQVRIAGPSKSFLSDKPYLGGDVGGSGVCECVCMMAGVAEASQKTT